MYVRPLLALLCCTSLLIGCAGRKTTDPALMLQWSAEEFNKNEDPVAAEELLQQALKIYRMQMNRVGLAETYRQYGLFLRSNAVTRNEEHYNTAGFLDETIRYKTRYDKAIEFFNKSKEIYMEQQLFESLSNVYLSMAKTYALMNRPQDSCDTLQKGRDSFASFKRAPSEKREVGTEDAANYIGYISTMQSQMGCIQ